MFGGGFALEWIPLRPGQESELERKHIQPKRHIVHSSTAFNSRMIPLEFDSYSTLCLLTFLLSPDRSGTMQDVQT